MEPSHLIRILNLVEMVFQLISGHTSDLAAKQLELERKKKNLEASFEAGKISKSTYEYVMKELTNAFVKLETQMKTLAEIHEKPREVEHEKGFHFYEDEGKPTGQVALTLEDFARKARMVSIASIEFHQERGDFANWIRDVFEDYPLAEKVENLKEKGENLRKNIVETIEGLKQHNVFLCPNCGKEVRPKKIWNMPGRPNKAGKTLHLTLGYYQCSNCEKKFRRVLAKETKWLTSTTNSK